MPDRRTRRPHRARSRGATARDPNASPARPRVARATTARRASRPSRRARLAAGHTLVAVDIGNSEITLGVFDGDGLAAFWRLTTGRATADEITLQLDRLLTARVESRGLVGDGRGRGAPARLATPRGAVVCSVVPAATPGWIEALTRVTGAPPVEVTVATTPTLAIRYHDKTAVGADRLANAIAVRALYGTPAIVVDLGTATTFDCVSRQGAYLGGAITLGIGAVADELFRRAARIPRVDLLRPSRAIGRTTEEALGAGIVWGHAGQIDALVRRLALEMKGTPHVIATGGYASLVAPECETINRVDPALTLKGMKLIWEDHR